MSARRPAAPDPRDPLGLRADAPLLHAYLRALEEARVPFTIPGHKGRTGLVGTVVAGDVPLFGGLDTPKLAAGTLAAAEALAARHWGADLARFSVGGSTHGNQALALALGAPGDRVVVGRTLHRSLLLWLILAGLEPIWVRPELDPATGLPGAVPPAAVAEALARHPEARAVLLGDPSYVGSTSDLVAHAALAHGHGAAGSRGIPLIVDAAWGGHFGAGPSVPPHALAQGADALVTSVHKLLPGYTQAAIVLARTARLDPGRLDRAFEASNTTSPAGAILASVDASRALLARDGERLVARAVELVGSARERLRAVEGLAVVEPARADPLRLVLGLAGTGASGIELDRDLAAAGMPIEMTDRDTAIPVITLADDEASVDGLVRALVASIERHRRAPRPVVPAAAWAVGPRAAIPPREAFFAPRERLPIERAIGRVSAELVAPYPPGIPVLAPGELVEAGAVEALLEAARQGVRIAYAADPTLATLEVVA